MANDRTVPPEGRYGRSRAERARTDRRLTITGIVLGVALLAFVAWAGISYVSEQRVSGELTTFDVVSDTEVRLSLAVRKPADTDGVCTVRAQAEDGLEVGRTELRLTDEGDDIHRAFTLRTTERATAVELLSCSEAS
ncbi:DUF4307 domain-containing protein [Streptomyces sp. 4N509B]|uniref:DUF4307 domain-containing protein n=1 Tax=Streptomyces sp. 4N509B TaxID=3457413 RepID=UPI003FD6525A